MGRVPFYRKDARLSPFQRLPKNTLPAHPVATSQEHKCIKRKQQTNKSELV